jgi:hypothetical protein
MTTIPHVYGIRDIRSLVPQGFAAMRKSASSTKLPHVARDYLRPEEVNAVIAAAANQPKKPQKRPRLHHVEHGANPATRSAERRREHRELLSCLSSPVEERRASEE